MGLGKTYSTKYLLDSNNNTGAAGQVLISTATGIDWSDGSDIIGGPYLPLTGGTLTGNLLLNDNVELRLGTSSDFKAGHTGSYTYMYNYTGHMYLRNFADNSDIIFQTDDNSGGYTSYLVLDGSSGDSYFSNPGNVGIGTTGPFSTLQVGQATFTGANGMVNNSRVGISNHGSLTGMMLASTYNDANYPEYGLVFIQGPSTSSYNVWSISPDGPAKGSGLSFIYKANATNIHNQTPQVYFEGSTGNVGIGTITPSSKLHLRDPAANSDVGIKIGNDSRDWNLKVMGSVSDSLQFFTHDNSNVMTILPSGNVGIGTTSPQSKLHIQTETAPSDIYLTDGTVGTDNYGGVIRGFSTAGQGGRLQLGTLDNDIYYPALTILEQGGNVGIGTTGPGAKLEVESATTAYNSEVGAIIISDATTPAKKLVSGIDTSLGTYGSAYIQAVYSGTNILPLLLNPMGGNVGIGTTSPAAKLTISDANATGLEINPLDSQNRVNIIAYDRVDSAYRELNFDGSNYNFEISNSTKMVIDTSGNVGIGTTSPRFQLDLVEPQASSQTDYIALGVDNGPSNGEGNDLGCGIIWKANYTGYTKRSAGVIQIAQGSSFRSALAFYTNNSTASTGDFSERMRIDMDGNVGIGKTPQSDARLHTYRNSTDAYNIFESSTNRWVFGEAGGVCQVGGRYGHHSGININTTGNVGIGTATPVSKLHVQSGAIGVTTGQKIGWIYNPGTDNNMYNYILTADNGGVPATPLEISGSRWTNSNTRSVVFTHQTGGEIMTIMTGGNVGIGTTSPIDKLNVNGGTGDTSTQDSKLALTRTSSTGNVLAGKMVLKHKATNFGNLVFQVKTTASSAENSAYYTDAITIDGQNANVGIGTDSPGAALDIKHASVPLITRSTNNNGIAMYNEIAGGYSNLYLYQVNASAKIVLASNGDSYFNGGNVGIGITAPDSKLHVHETSTVGGKWEVAKFEGDIGVGGGITLSSSSSGAEWSLIAQGASGGALANNLGFHLTNAGTSGGALGYKMTLEASSGYLGIGTTNPAAKLDIALTTGPQLRLTRNAGTEYAELYSDSAGGLVISSYSSGTSNYQVFSINSSEKVRIINNGNVGIGTTSPGYKLDVAEKIRMVGGLKITPTTSSLYNQDGALSYYGSTNGVYLNGAGANGWLRLQASGVENDVNAINIYGSASAYMTFRTANSTRMIINSAGNVGIGTTSPGSKLQVAGEIRVADGTKAAPSYSFTSDTNTGMYSDAADTIKLVVGGDDTLIINSSSNVGIGTSAPDVKFHVTTSEDGSGIDKGTAKFINTNTGQGATTMHVVQTSSSAYANAVKFWQGSTPTAVGFIRLTTSATQFITSASDLNLKKNITTWSDDTLSKFKALEPKKFRFKTQDTSEDKTLGFIAQNEVDNFPEAYPQFLGEDEKPYYGFNPTGMVPHLMKAIKDLVEKVETLENKITQLENNN